MSSIRHRVSAPVFARFMVAVVSVAIIFAGLAMSTGAYAAFHASGAAPDEMVLTAAVKDCCQPTKDDSASQQTHMACGNGMNCFAFTAANKEISAAAKRQPAFAPQAVRHLVTRKIVPPSPPPKSIVAA